MSLHECIKQMKSQRQGALRDTHKMGKGLHRVFSTIVSEISQELTNFMPIWSLLQIFLVLV